MVRKLTYRVGWVGNEHFDQHGLQNLIDFGLDVGPIFNFLSHDALCQLLYLLQLNYKRLILETVDNH